MDFRIGGLIYTSKFDSGNLHRVEKVSRDEDDESANNSCYPGHEAKPDYEVNMWTKPDCGGTQFENGNRSWFHFGIRGWSPCRLIKINIMNMNRQGKLYSQGHAPVVRIIPNKPKWERIRDRPSYENVDNQFILSFTYRFPECKGATVYFAFSYPWSYTESQEQLESLDKKFEHCKNFSPDSPPDSIYYHRELLCHTLDKLRVDLVTITSCHGICSEREPKFDDRLFPETDEHRCREFKGKRAYILSSRVHPGETPASHVFNGFLEFILREHDCRAQQLRKMFVFKLIPMLNPDGVMRGHYRTDQLGVNLNRMYLDPNFDLHPSIYAAKSVIVYHHVHYRVRREGDGKEIEVNFPNSTACSSSPTCNVSVKRSESVNSLSTVEDLSSRTVAGNTVRSYDDSNVGLSSGHLNQGDSGQSEHYTWIHDHVKVPKLEHVNSPVPVKPKPFKIEPLNLADLDGTDTSLSDSGLAAESTVNVTASCCSVLSSAADTVHRESNVESDLRLRLSQLNLSEDFSASRNPLNALFDDSDEDDDTARMMTEHLGNEGSEDEGELVVTHTNSPHLSDPKLRDIPPYESGIAVYVDLHGHASKRGCFIYGNYFETEDIQVENMMFTKLISLNTAHFDFGGCNFSERNMYSKDKRDGMSKEGSGRVAIYKATGIIHSYTLECNYNTGRMVNTVAPAYRDNGRATPPPTAGFPPKYTQAHYEEVGRATAIAALDMTESNPWSRLLMSEHSTLHGVRDSVRRYLRGLRGSRASKNPIPKNGGRNSLFGSLTNNGRSFRTTDSSHGAFSRSFINNSDSNSTVNARSNASGASRPILLGRLNRKELAPVREPRASLSNQTRQRMTLPMGNLSSSKPTSASSVPVTTQMTVDTDEKSQERRRQLSADSSLRIREEDKYIQLKNSGLVNLSKKTGSQSRIPLPTTASRLQLPAHSSMNVSAHAKLMARGNLRNARLPMKTSTIPPKIGEQSNTESGAGGLSAVVPNSDLQAGNETLSSETYRRKRRPSQVRCKNTSQSPMNGGQNKFVKQSSAGSELDKRRRRRNRRHNRRHATASPKLDDDGEKDLLSIQGGKQDSILLDGSTPSQIKLSPRLTISTCVPSCWRRRRIPKFKSQVKKQWDPSTAIPSDVIGPLSMSRTVKLAAFWVDF